MTPGELISANWGEIEHAYVAHVLSYDDDTMLRVETPEGRVAIAVRAESRHYHDWISLYAVRIEDHPQAFMFGRSSPSPELYYVRVLNPARGGRRRIDRYVDYFLRYHAFWDDDGKPRLYCT